MKAKEIERFRDGGTSKVLAENGKTYWIDRRIGTNTFERVYDSDPHKITAELAHVTLEVEYKEEKVPVTHIHF